MATRLRKDVWKLAKWDPILEWFAKAVAEMQERPIGDPTSWRYQAAIHDHVVGADPNAQPGDMLPSSTERAKFWRQCQHFCWFFLPWHRMYLRHFERIVAATVVQLGGPADWALPYWNYSDASNPNARRIPEAFRELTLPGGGANTLRVEERDEGNDGSEVGFPEDVDVCDCLKKKRFVAQSLGGDPGFGGGQSGFNHSRGLNTIAGELERVPHGAIHTAVGGFMSQFDTAGLDPLFWLHHANIDRLWEVWRRRDPQNLDPTQALWLTGVTFSFHNELGNVVTHKSTDVVDTKKAPLEYEYQDVSDPCASPQELAAAEVSMSDRTPEMVGATDRPIQLTGGEPAVAQLSTARPTGPASAAESAGAAPPEIYLNIENITGTGKPVSYSVYLNVPPGESAEDHPELFAGVLPMFGVAEASRPDENHPGSGLHYALEVSEIVRRLESRQAWDPANVQITFVPRRRARVAESAAEAAVAPIQVGRVSLYFA
jgi:tyrosinase